LSGTANHLKDNIYLVTTNNHSGSVATGLGFAGIVLSEFADPNEAQSWLNACIDRIAVTTSHISPDGSYKEGVYYGEFNFSLIAYIMFYIYKTTGTNILHGSKLLQNMELWFLDIQLYDGKIPLFDDAVPRTSLYEILLLPMTNFRNEYFENIKKHTKNGVNSYQIEYLLNFEEVAKNRTRLND